MFKDVLIIVISNGLFLTIIAFLLKSTINHVLTKNIESYKIMLKADIDRMAFEHQTRFSQLHENRGKTITELYELLSVAIRSAGDFASPAEWAGEKPKSEKAQIAWKAIMEFYRYFDNKRIFLTVDTCAKIEAIFVALRDPVFDFAILINSPYDNPEISKMKQDTWMKSWNSIDKGQVPVARRALEEEFRKLLGVDN